MHIHMWFKRRRTHLALNGHCACEICVCAADAWQVIKVRGAGMPVRDADPPRNGTLHVRALVEFPASLSPETQRLAELLPDA